MGLVAGSSLHTADNQNFGKVCDVGGGGPTWALKKRARNAEVGQDYLISPFRGSRGSIEGVRELVLRKLNP